MEIFKIKLNKINDLQHFVNACSQIRGEVTIPQGRFIINAKSIMGMMSIDLSQELTVQVDEEYLDELLDKIKEIRS